MSAPNVLLVVWDTCRRDALEPFGAATGASPVAADLARRGTVAADVHAVSGWTMPSHTALFSGVLPRELGLTQAPGGTVASCRDAIAALDDRLLASVLRRAGYETKGSSANIWISPEGGFDTGFDFFELVRHNRHGGMHREGLRHRVEWGLHAVRGRADDGAAHQRGRVLRWIGELGDRPLFGFVNLNECHSPYLPPLPFNSCGPIGRARAADEARRYLNLMAIWRVCAGGELPPEGALERMRRLYADSVRQMDAWLGDVLEALDRAGRLDDTLVILTSDHGENFGEGNYLAHAFSVDERLTHVPLVAAGPGAERMAGLRTLADLPRRVAEIAGVADHPYAEQASAVSQSDPPGGPEDPRLLGLADDWPEISTEQLVERLALPLTAAVEGRHKLLLRGEAEEFYDLDADPLEERPVPADALSPAVRDALRAAVAGAVRPAGEVAAAPATVDDSAEIEERMKLLGYM